MNQNNNDDNYQDRMAIERERMNLERLKNSKDAHERNLKESLKSALQDASTRKNVARDIVAASKGRQADPLTEAISKRGGASHVVDDELITGFEDRPWERD